MPKDKPEKPYPTFPLFAHTRGQWMKTIGKKHVGFGRWEPIDNKLRYEASWKAALDAYNKHLEDVAHGRHLDENPDEITLRILINAYLTYMHGRLDRREIKAKHFSDVKVALTRFRDELGADRTIGDVERDGITDIRAYLDGLHRGYGWCAYNRHIQSLRAVFKWAADPIEGVLGRPFRLMTLLVKQGELQRKREVKAKVVERGQWCWTQPELWNLLHAGGIHYTAMMLLGYFGCFGNTDCADLTLEHVNFDPDPDCGLPPGWGYIYFPRPKNEMERSCVLPPFVCDVLRASIATRPKPARPQWEKLVFVTKNGLPYVREKIHRREDGTVKSVVCIDTIQLLHTRARERLGECPTHGPMLNRTWLNGKCPDCEAGLRPARSWGFYTYRHTATTYASGTSTPDAIALWEGHAIKGVRSRYVSHVEIPRLKPIADALYARLFSRNRSGPAVPASAASDVPASSSTDVRPAAA